MAQTDKEELELQQPQESAENKEKTLPQQKETTPPEESAKIEHTPITAQNVEAPQIKNNYEKYWSEYKNVNPFDEEEYNRRKRKAKTAMVLESLNKGLASISKVVQAAQGRGKAPGTKGPKIYEGLKSKPYYDEIEKERQANKTLWDKGAQNFAKYGQDAEKENAKLKYQADSDNANRQLKAEKDEEEQKRKNAKTAADIAKGESAAEDAKDLTNAKIGTEKAKQYKYESDAGSNRIKAEKSGSSSSKGNTYRLALDRNYETDSKEEYEKWVHEAAKKMGVSETRIEKTGEGRYATQKIINKTVSELAGDVEKEYQERHPSGSSSSSSGKGKGYGKGKGKGYGKK